jgi:protein-disulfide isomerase
MEVFIMTENGDYPSGAQYDSRAPYNAPPIKYVEVSINVSFDITVTVPEEYNRTHLIEKAEAFRLKYNIKEEVAYVEENF